ncbi:uncharacterized protein BP01DRAFT_352443 [Aspergillus saccharolyticus JOP 1030-1]|uniref:DUF6314 domain-containing protein n=1 Tax=Aspergillus saccharolyticus JOP 1030-1 TaxID=1450539 RepID=A0A319AEI8_9EURO|nr:hypothetical protein BP01DRAFT_352443 [Aspergillus saccharolyticus JOP 1030-1]PYH49908.1 hypothetical protein BP01DRAFT_352443 [Aspergillus saccharolyticus JOP 1030-1]
MSSPISPHLLPTLFASLARTPRWTLRRTLQSDNPLDLHGDLHGEASFRPLPATAGTTAASTTRTTTTETTTTITTTTQTLYTESGTLPATLGANLRWTKSYIWRLSPEGRISVWFVKVTKDADVNPEADYLFHEVEFEVDGVGGGTASDPVAEGDHGTNDQTYVTPPVPPEAPQSLSPSEAATVVLTARGNHLCIKDMYRTAYAFRVRAETGEVVSWASRHVVKGPKKDQDIVNLYSVG